MKKSVIFLISCLSLLVSCAGGNSYRLVHDNTLFSRYMPRNEIQVIDEIQYVGDQDSQVLVSTLNEVHSSRNMSLDSWLFVEAGEYKNDPQFVKRGVYITVEEISPSVRTRFVTDSFSNVTNAIDKGRDQFLKKNYDWVLVLVTQPFGDSELRLLKSKGYTMPKACMTKYSLRKISGRGLLTLVYFESLQRNQSFYDNVIPYDEQLKGWDQEYLTAFIQRSKAAFEIREYTGDGLPPEIQ